MFPPGKMYILWPSRCIPISIFGGGAVVSFNIAPLEAISISVTAQNYNEANTGRETSLSLGNCSDSPSPPPFIDDYLMAIVYSIHSFEIQAAKRPRNKCTSAHCTKRADDEILSCFPPPRPDPTCTRSGPEQPAAAVLVPVPEAWCGWEHTPVTGGAVLDKAHTNNTRHTPPLTPVPLRGTRRSPLTRRALSRVRRRVLMMRGGKDVRSVEGRPRKAVAPARPT